MAQTSPQQISGPLELPPVQYKLRKVWEASAKRLGYKTIEAAIVGTYQKTGSLRKTAELLNFSYTTVWHKLVKLGIPRRSPGGANNPYGRQGKDVS